MGEMVERVARQLCVIDWPNPDALGVFGEPPRFPMGYVIIGEPRPLWTFYVSRARAVLQAMGEGITQVMVVAGQDELETCVDREEWSDRDGTRYSRDMLQLAGAPNDLWRAMIKAELES